MVAQEETPQKSLNLVRFILTEPSMPAPNTVAVHLKIVESYSVWIKWM